MSTWIAGSALVKDHGILPFQLIDFLKAGVRSRDWQGKAVVDRPKVDLDQAVAEALRQVTIPFTSPNASDLLKALLLAYNVDDLERLRLIRAVHVAQVHDEPNPESRTEGPVEDTAQNGGTPEQYIARLRSEGFEEQSDIAIRLKEQFPLLSDAKVGALLPARPGTVVGYAARRDRGRRLLGKK